MLTIFMLVDQLDIPLLLQILKICLQRSLLLLQDSSKACFLLSIPTCFHLPYVASFFWRFITGEHGSNISNGCSALRYVKKINSYAVSVLGILVQTVLLVSCE
uniref:Uncharacterized protein n=1 Tax=Helianthus annuus TaxID=4232 RepID=A0A251RW70_HELAN